MAATLQEEGDNTQADVFFAQDPGGLGSVEDLLIAMPQDILDQVPDWARSSEGRWVGISGRAGVIVYSTDNLQEGDLPQRYLGLYGPQVEGPNRMASNQRIFSDHDHGHAQTLG